MQSHHSGSLNDCVSEALTHVAAELVYSELSEGGDSAQVVCLPCCQPNHHSTMDEAPHSATALLLAGMSTFSTKGGLYERAARRFGLADGMRLFSYAFFDKQRLEALVRPLRTLLSLSLFWSIHVLVHLCSSQPAGNMVMAKASNK